MEPEAKYTLVGAAALILVALMAAAIMWLRSSGEGANASRYKIYFEHYSLEGLEPRSHVTMQGMKVGSVTGFRFSSSRKGAVEVFISLDPATPVRKSTTATTERHLVTGLATVRLANATEDSPLLVDVPEGEPFPVIREGGSTQQMSDTVTQMAQRADDTLRRLNATLTPENIAAFTEILDNLRKVSRRADALVAKADATLASVGGAADDVRAMAIAIKADAGALTQKYATLGTDATASIGEMREAVRKMGADVDRLSKRADALLATGDEDLRDTARAVRAAADSLGAAAARLRDPRQAIYGPPEGGLGPGGEDTMKSVLGILLAASVAACSVPGPREPDRYFVLDAGIGAGAAPRAGAPVAVAPTSAASFYDTQDIAFSRAPGTRAYYQFNRWTERPQRSIHGLLASRLEGGAAQPALRLDTHLEEIYHDASEEPGTARITIAAVLVDPASRAVHARRTFTRSAPAASYDAPGAVRGFNQALAALIGDIEGWVQAESGPKSRP